MTARPHPIRLQSGRVHALLLFAFAASAFADPPTPGAIEAGYRTLAAAIESEEAEDLTAVLAESFQYAPADGRPMRRPDWVGSWARNFRDVDYTAVSYHVESSQSTRAGLYRVIAERTIFFRAAGARAESVQVCHTEDEWAGEGGRWLLQSQRELDIPEDGEVAAGGPAEGGGAAPGSERLRRLRQDLDAGRVHAAEEFLAELRGRAPLLENASSDATRRLVTFVYQGTPDIQGVRMAGGPYRSAPKALTRFDGTDLWFRTENVPADSKFVYFLTVTRPRRRVHADGRTGDPTIVTLATRDPLNPITFNGGSVVWPSDAPPPDFAPQRAAPLRGTFRDHAIRSTILGEERSFSVYAPPPSADPPPCLLVALDGEDYTGLIPTPAILDDLIATGRLPPTVGVFVNHQGLRFRDLRCSPAFSQFLATELVAWVRANYRATHRPRQTAVAGASLGGLAAAFLAESHPHVFGKVLSQSGAYWYHPEPGQDGWLATRFAGADRRPVEFWMEVGAFESPAMVHNNRRLRDVLRAKGIAVKYREFNGGHDYLTWRESIADGLVHLLGQGR